MSHELTWPANFCYFYFTYLTWPNWVKWIRRDRRMEIRFIIFDLNRSKTALANEFLLEHNLKDFEKSKSDLKPRGTLFPTGIVLWCSLYYINSTSRPFFVYFVRWLILVRLHFDLQLLIALLPLREYVDLNLILFEALL